VRKAYRKPVKKPARHHRRHKHTRRPRKSYGRARHSYH
jgi:hypothetical protein